MSSLSRILGLSCGLLIGLALSGAPAAMAQQSSPPWAPTPETTNHWCDATDATCWCTDPIDCKNLVDGGYCDGGLNCDGTRCWCDMA